MDSFHKSRFGWKAGLAREFSDGECWRRNRDVVFLNFGGIRNFGGRLLLADRTKSMKG